VAISDRRSTIADLRIPLCKKGEQVFPEKNERNKMAHHGRYICINQPLVSFNKLTTFMLKKNSKKPWD